MRNMVHKYIELKKKEKSVKVVKHYVYVLNRYSTCDEINAMKTAIVNEDYIKFQNSFDEVLKKQKNK